MKSLLLKIKLLELEIEKNKNLIALDQALLHQELGTPKAVCIAAATGFVGAFLYPILFKTKAIQPALSTKNKLKHHINTAQVLYRKFQAITPFLTMLRLIP